MQTIKAETRTTYSVRFTYDDFTKALDGFIADRAKESARWIMNAAAFKGITADSTTDDVRRKFSNWLNMDAATLSYLAAFFGFDGWDNSGYNVDDSTVQMVFYRNGATL